MLKLKNQLEALDKSILIDMIIQLSESSFDNKKMINLSLASNNPMKVAKMLMKAVSTLEKAAPRYDYKEANRVSHEIEHIVSQVEKYLLGKAPNLAIDILKELISIDDILFDHIDDSYGAMGCAYTYLYSVLDQAFASSDESPESIAEYLIETYLDDEYGCRHSLFHEINHCLKDEKAIFLEKAVLNHPMKPYLKSDILKKTADLSNDVDKYIQAVSMNLPINPSDACEVAKRLLKANRPNEAIDWLSHVQNGCYQAVDRDKLLVQAYEASGSPERAQRLRWDIFDKFCDVESYKN